MRHGEAGEPDRRADDPARLRLVPGRAGRGELAAAVHDRGGGRRPLGRRLPPPRRELPVRPADVAVGPRDRDRGLRDHPLRARSGVRVWRRRAARAPAAHAGVRLRLLTFLLVTAARRARATPPGGPLISPLLPFAFLGELPARHCHTSTPSCASGWRSCVRRARGSSRPATPSAGGSSATSTTALSRASSRSRCFCGSRAHARGADPDLAGLLDRAPGRAADEPRGAARARARDPPRRADGARARRRRSGRSRRARRCRSRSRPTRRSGFPARSRVPRTSSSRRRSRTSRSTRRRRGRPSPSGGPTAA